MVLHQMVDGVKVKCTPEEEAQIRKEWKQNEFYKERKKSIKRKEEEMKKAVTEKVRKRLGLTQQEMELFLKKSQR